MGAAEEASASWRRARRANRAGHVDRSEDHFVLPRTLWAIARPRTLCAGEQAPRDADGIRAVTPPGPLPAVRTTAGRG
ncbi:hypothetical protein, partial [Streptomyces sp. NPDC127103]|uniref:hypothetical protein n=1 Tax=Streptomyces sp. NPDC127103 TaxID=3347139 RepID=UPI00365290F6